MRSLLVPWRSFPEFDDLRAELDRMFEVEGEPRVWRMAVDVVEGEGKLVVRADVPGIKPEEVKIAVENGTLTISAEHEESTEESGERFTRRERRRGSFRRSMPLPEGVKVEDVVATTKDGVLEVTIPVPAHEPVKRVEITPKAG